MTHKRSKRLEARIAGNRERILVAARHLVAEGGWREAQMAAIAAAAELATGTVYRYFPSKAELFAEVLAVVSQREVGVVSGIADSDGHAAEKLAAAVRVFCERALKGRRLAYALIAEPCEPEIDRERLVYRRQLGEQFLRIIEEGVKHEEFALQNPRISASCVVGSFMEALVGPLAPDSKEIESTQAGYVEEIVRFCLRAVIYPSHKPQDMAESVVLRVVRTHKPTSNKA